MGRCVPLALCLCLLACDEPEPLPSIGVVPHFELTDHRGRRFGNDQLQGKLWAANFMFTSCPDVCPRLTQQMAGLRKRLDPHADEIHFVSFSVDPDTDTPEVLAKYAKQRGADFDNWFFLTGDLTAVKRVVVDGFKQSMEPVREEGKPFNVLHGSHFVLIDDKGVIRGFYGSDNRGTATLAKTAEGLLSGGR